MMTKLNSIENGYMASGERNETSWFYHGPDDGSYGPYTAKDMLTWTTMGYFNETLPIRTEHEDRFHTLGEWTRACGGKLPFLLPVFSLDMVQQQQQRTVVPPMMLMPNGMPHFPPAPVRFPPQYMPMMQHGGLGGGHGGPPHPIASQPPSEPIDAGSVAHTPDSEHDINQHMAQMQISAPQRPAMSNVLTQTNIEKRDVEVQTLPIIISSKDAARMLSELTGVNVLVA